MGNLKVIMLLLATLASPGRPLLSLAFKKKEGRKRRREGRREGGIMFLQSSIN